MAKSLWLATVDHVEVPGTGVALFYQTAEPSDRNIKSRFKKGGKPADLIVSGVFDISRVCGTDPASLKAIEAFDDANTRAEWRKKGA